MIPRPMLATAVSTLPAGQAWSYEVKWDGYRAVAVKDGPRVQLLSRNQKNLARDFPTVVAAVAALTSTRVVIDGEVVALDAEGRPSFQALQHRATGGLTLVYYAFDLLSVGDVSPEGAAREVRRQQLSEVVQGSRVLLSESLPGSVVDHQGATRKT